MKALPLAWFLYLLGPFSPLLAKLPCSTSADSLINTLDSKFYADADSTRVAANSLLQLAVECNSDSLRGKAYMYLADAYYINSSLDSAVYFYQVADGYFHRSDDTSGMMRIHFNLGNVFSEMGQIDQATTNYLAALPFYEKVKDTANIALIHYNISLLFFDQNNLEGAERRLKLAQQMCEPNHMYGSIYPDILQMLGHLYYLHGENDSAKLLLSHALEFADTMFIDQYQAYTFANLALIFMEESEYDSASFYVDAATVIALDAQDLFSTTNYLTIKAEILARKAQFTEALAIGDSALQCANLLSSIILRESCFNVLSDIYEMQGDYENAYLYLDSTYQMRDSLQLQNAEASILHYEREKRIAQNLALTAENRLIERERVFKEKQLNERTILLLIIGILLVLLLIAAIYLYQISQKRKRLNDAKDTILSVISHDLRGPIVQMKSLSDMLFDPATEEKNKIPILKNFNIAITNLQKSFDNILFWSKTQMQGLHVEAKKINLSHSIREILDFHMQSANAKGLHIDNHLNDELYVIVDANHLQIALRNIMSNAIKFSNNGNTIHVSCKVEQNFGKVTISDEGVGIDQEEMKKILNKRISFTRLGTTNEKGTGLGVMLSKQFILANKGDYVMESKPGKGTKVTIRLPLAN